MQKSTQSKRDKRPGRGAVCLTDLLFQHSNLHVLHNSSASERERILERAARRRQLVLVNYAFSVHRQPSSAVCVNEHRSVRKTRSLSDGCVRPETSALISYIMPFGRITVPWDSGGPLDEQLYATFERCENCARRPIGNFLGQKPSSAFGTSSELHSKSS